MPKIEPYFDVAGLCEQALATDLGLWVVTNNPANFRRTLYAHFRKHPEHRLHIYTDPASPTRFALLKQAMDPTDGQES